MSRVLTRDGGACRRRACGVNPADIAASKAPDAPHASEVIKRLLFKQKVSVGSCPTVDDLVLWLNAGAAQVLFTAQGNDNDLASFKRVVNEIAEALGPQCPAARIAVPLDISALSASTVAEVGDFVSSTLPGLGVELCTTASAISNQETQAELFALAKQLGEFRVTLRVVDAVQPEDVATFHRKYIDVKVEIEATESSRRFIAECYVVRSRILQIFMVLLLS